jgi:hypothetical protein
VLACLLLYAAGGLGQRGHIRYVFCSVYIDHVL